MKIGLISDTHVPRAVRVLPPQVFRLLDGVDLIFHAGDVYATSVLDELGRIAPVYAALGNGDLGLESDPRVQRTHCLKLGGLTIGLVHGLAYPYLPITATFGQPVDVVVFGDTHVATIERADGVLLVNPGSPTLPNNLVGILGTVGLLEVADGQAQATILPLSPEDARRLGLPR